MRASSFCVVCFCVACFVAVSGCVSAGTPIAWTPRPTTDPQADVVAVLARNPLSVSTLDHVRVWTVTPRFTDRALHVAWDADDGAHVDDAGADFDHVVDIDVVDYGGSYGVVARHDDGRADFSVRVRHRDDAVLLADALLALSPRHR